jgi:hypothetical protein
MHARFEPARPHDVLTLAAATWLACGIVLFGLTPLPWRDATLGWTPAFWLLAAPCVLLIARRAFPRMDETPRHHVRSIQRRDVPAPRRRKSNTRCAARAQRAAA